ncbi:MAG: SEC-C domain-containing protein [Deltaproteobacteria bacterium]|nr:SEC-C domain-containing protein [Deltaproteobacteria bacterium]
MSKVGRNDACPCGSGKKYKNCHLGRALPTADGVEVEPAEPGAALAKKMIPGLVMTLLLGGLGAFLRGGEGLLVGAAVGVFAGVGWVMMQNPPPPSDNSGGSSINFGS